MYKPKEVNQTVLKYYTKLQEYQDVLAYLEELLLETKIEKEQIIDDIRDIERKLHVLCVASNTSIQDVYKVVHYNEE